MKFICKIQPAVGARDGISIIEVLTAMAVATIGVFGVMVLIPFAVKQSQSGLDNDSANVLGRNVIEELETNGAFAVNGGPPAAQFSRRLGILFPQVNFANGTPTATGGDVFSPLYPSLCGAQIGPTSYPGIVHLDPIGFSSVNLNSGGITIPTATFYNLPDPPENQIPIATFFNPPPLTTENQSPILTPIAADEAARLCRYRDNLISEIDNESIDDVAPPQPIFDRDGGINGPPVKRQFSGRISWSALLVPEKDPSIVSIQVPANRYRVYTLVYRDRDRVIADPEVENFPCYQTNMSGTGFQPSVISITIDPIKPLPAADDPDRIRNGDWVMVINRLPSLGSNSGGLEAQAGYDIQVMFARVTDVIPNSDDPNNIGRMLVDGGSFAFTPVVGGGSETFVVHLRNVISVYERTVSIENN